MNTKVKFLMLAFAICFIVGSVIYLVTIRKPAEKPTVVREQLLRAVENAKRGDREELAGIIRDLGAGRIYIPKKLLPDFISFLKEKDPQVQLLGARGLHVLKNPKSKGALSEYLKGKDFAKLEKMVYAGDLDERHAEWEMQASSSAILTLGEVGDESVIPLLESLRSVKELQFEFGGGPVEEALAKLGAEGIRSLSNLGPEADHPEINKAAGVIRGVRDPKMAPQLIATINDANCAIGIRCAALGALGEIKEVDSLPFLLSVLKQEENSPYLRKSAASAAVRSGQPQVVEQALLKILEDPQSDIFAGCLEALVCINTEEYLPVQINSMLDKSVSLKQREEMASGIYTLSPEKIKPHVNLLKECLKAVDANGRPEDEIRIGAWRALNRATGEEPLLELSDPDSLSVKDHFSSIFRQKFIAENVHASAAETRRMVDEKISSIVVKWQPEKGGEKP